MWRAYALSWFNDLKPQKKLQIRTVIGIFI